MEKTTIRAMIGEMWNKMKTLIFEGAGCVPCNDIENCRIRTRIKTKDGRIIYLECTSLEKNEDFIGFVDYCFDVKDQKTNHTPYLAPIERMQFNYSREGLLDFVNKNLNCDFDMLDVQNEGLRVHDTDKPLCSCEVI